MDKYDESNRSKAPRIPRIRSFYEACHPLVYLRFFACLSVNLQKYVPCLAVRPICDNIGINWTSQYKHLKNDPILSTKLMSVVFNTTDIDPDSKRPLTSTMIALPLQFLYGWLFRIDSRRVKESVRADLIRYQKRCYAILAEVFNSAQSPTGRHIQLYRKADRSEEWIRNRLQGINTRVARVISDKRHIIDFVCL